MKNNFFPEGLWPVMLTPFLENNKVDYTGLENLTDFYIKNGAKGLFANCLSSEMFQLTDSERLQIISTVVSTVQSEIPVVATGTFSTDIDQCSRFISKVYDTGVVAVILVTNQFAAMEETEDSFKKNIEQLLKNTVNIPLGLYECPVPYKRLLSPSLMQWLAATGRFFYHKDTSCDPVAIKNKLKAIAGTPLSLYNANTATALSSLEFGAKGISPVGANLYPELYSFLANEFKEKGATLQLVQLNEQLDIMDTVVDLCYPFSAKLFLQKRGLPITTHCRIPYGNVSVENRLKLESLLEVFRFTADRFNITTRIINCA